MQFFIKNSKGLTLVEVTVSMIMVGIIALAIVSAVSQGAIYSRRVDLVYDSAYLAQRRIELLKKFDFDQLYPGAAETNTRIGLDGTVDVSGDLDIGFYTVINPIPNSYSFMIDTRNINDVIIDGPDDSQSIIFSQ